MSGPKAHRNYFLVACVLMFLFIQIIYPMPGPMLYIYDFACVFFILSKAGEGMSIKFQYILFLLATTISIVGNTIPIIFKPWERFTLLILVVIACSPMISGPGVNRARRQIFMGSLWALVLIVAWSFIGYFTGQGQYITGFVNG